MVNNRATATLTFLTTLALATALADRMNTHSANQGNSSTPTVEPPLETPEQLTTFPPTTESPHQTPDQLTTETSEEAHQTEAPQENTEAPQENTKHRPVNEKFGLYIVKDGDDKHTPICTCEYDNNDPPGTVYPEPKTLKDGDSMEFPTGIHPGSCCAPHNFRYWNVTEQLIHFCMLSSERRCGKRFMITATPDGEKVCGSLKYPWAKKMNKRLGCIIVP